MPVLPCRGGLPRRDAASADGSSSGGDRRADHEGDDAEVDQPERNPEEHAQVAQPQPGDGHSVAAFTASFDLRAGYMAEDDADDAEEEERGDERNEAEHQRDDRRGVR